MAAAIHFANIPELLIAMGHHVENKKTLYNLCLTSRLFHVVFTEALYWEIHVTLDPDNVEVLQTLAKMDSVRFARIFSCTMKSRNGSTELSSQLHQKINLLMEKMLEKMKELTILRWHGLVIANFVMYSLQRWCPKLQSVSVGFPETQSLKICFPHGYPLLKPRSEAIVRLCSAQPLTSLAQLTSLSLTRLPVDLLPLRLAGRIAAVLRQSPNLRILRLSAAVEAMWRTTNTGPYQPLQDMCAAYVGSPRPAPAPLRLHTLQLGVGFWVPEHVRSLRDFFRTIDTSRLQTLHIDTDMMGFAHFRTQQALPSFRPWLPPRCPALRSLSVNALSPSVARFLHTCRRLQPEWIRRLAFQAYSISQVDWWETTHLQGVEGVLLQSVTEGWPLAFRAVRVGTNLDREYLSSEELTEEVLGIVADACGDSAEGLAVSINTAGWMSDEAKDILVRGLERMLVLRQLWVGSMERLPPGVIRNTSMSSHDTEALVLRLAGAVQTLEYVKIGDKAYRVQRRVAGAVWKIEPLEWPRQREVEMFRLPWNEIGGVKSNWIWAGRD